MMFCFQIVMFMFGIYAINLGLSLNFDNLLCDTFWIFLKTPPTKKKKKKPKFTSRIGLTLG